MMRKQKMIPGALKFNPEQTERRQIRNEYLLKASVICFVVAALVMTVGCSTTPLTATQDAWRAKCIRHPEQHGYPLTLEQYIDGGHLNRYESPYVYCARKSRGIL